MDSTSTQILTISKNSTPVIDNQVAKSCRAVKFTSDLKTHEILEQISKLDQQIYKKLSLFIIEDENFEFSAANKRSNSRKQVIKDLKRHVEKFHNDSSKMMMQLYSKNERSSKFYFRTDLRPFVEINCKGFVRSVDDQLLKLMIEDERSLGRRQDLKNREENLRIFKIVAKSGNTNTKIGQLTLKRFHNIFSIMKQEPKEKYSGNTSLLNSLNNILKENYAEHCLFYVDVKKLNDDFNPTNIRHDFESFIANIIKKSNSNFEAEVFKKLYRNGKVNILIGNSHKNSFETADCIIKLLKSFQRNGGNQIWIAANADFGDYLKQKLKLDDVYMLDDITEEVKDLLIKGNNNYNKNDPTLFDLLAGEIIFLDKLSIF